MDKADALAQVNRARLLNGLMPLAVNAALEKAAQRHSQDMADKGFLDHIGSDSSKLDDRVVAAGYSSWIGQQVWAESLYAGNGGFAEALEFWLGDEAEQRALLDPRFREIGIGVAMNTSPAGVETAYWTLVFGAQPNALPVFINDGAVTTNMPQVAVRLAQEAVMPEGEGNAIGKAIEVRVSADPSFVDAEWQQWEALLPFTFEDKPGLKTIYVQYRDTSDRMTVSTAGIQYDPNSTPVVIAIGPGVSTSQTLPVDGAPIDGAPVDGGPAGAPVVVTESSADAGGSGAQPAQPQASQAASPAATTPVVDANAAGQSVVAVVPTQPPGQATPAGPGFGPLAPDESGGVAAPSRPDAVLPDWLLPAVVIGQVSVIVLGLAALLKRKQV